MSTLDLLLSLLVVAAAAGFLVWQLGLRRRPPACHPSRTKSARPASGGSNVVTGDKLARALAKAQRRRRESTAA